MTNAGNPDSSTEATPETSSRLSWGCLIPILAFLGITIYILGSVGAQSLGVFVAIIAPPMPPLPASSELIETKTDSLGRTIWHYESMTSACDLIAFYEATGAECDIFITCPQDAVQTGFNAIAHCIDDQTFLNFMMRWEVELRLLQPNDTRIHLLLSRLITWTDAPLPEPTSLFILPR